MTSNRHSENGFSMTQDQIFITDVGTDTKDNAFFWLSIGRYVYDCSWNEVTIRALEREIDPDAMMSPVILRGYLWKTVPTRYWQVYDGHQLGPLPSQPGLDERMSDIYYGDNITRQISPTTNALAVQQTKRRPSGRRDLPEHPNGRSNRHHLFRRSEFCEGSRRRVGNSPSKTEHCLTRQPSVDGLFSPRACQNETLEILDKASAPVKEESKPEYVVESTDHVRKCFMGPDSGVDLSSDEDDSDFCDKDSEIDSP
ncbi:uncharacterized protein PV09_00522 [Verruconis gallopava]|uniref:Uncharacterized protein n=1 Tax=Verruconis gallopava TaxID=253628 RepID=A0A0D1Z6J2_9PEZI|nr:uncharacterized protein PV09_00522 [Verruconis gallopava]KIW08557.1 hypothetical protein PV09_00522 [Verruconis gallopava]